jgi:hypothetical protein
MSRYVHNDGLFAGSYFERVLADPRFPRERALPADGRARLIALRGLWEGVRGQFLRDARVEGRVVQRAYAGLPEHHEPVRGVSESEIENKFIRPVCEQILGYAAHQNRTMLLSGAAAAEAHAAQRPDLVLFAQAATRDAVVQRFGSRGLDGDRAGAPDGVEFCRSAALIVDAKRFDKGVGADEVVDPKSKRSRSEPTAMEDVRQVERYLRGYDRPWGVLTNGRCWRLMRQGKVNEHLRFDLVRFLEDQRGREPSDDDLATFALFWSLFGPPAVAGGYLAALEAESNANTRHVRDVLRDQAHAAVQEIARGFWSCPSNGAEGLTCAPALPEQAELDHLREVALTLLYRLLFILKAEAQELLPMRGPLGDLTAYARKRSTRAIFSALDELPADERAQYSEVYDRLLSLFGAIDRGDAQYGVPAYNGGLFDNEKHPELARWRLLDGALHGVLRKLIYLEDSDRPVPYGDLDVRDLGDIYEGLLEQRLVGRATSPPSLHLQNQRGERKASGSYFTPDGIVEHLVRRTLSPLLDAAGGDADRVLALRVLDPGMGSGHFLVKAVDVIADHLTVHCDPVDPEAPRDNGPAERGYWKRKVVESCIYGVDYNPMAVELARVALWLYTAEYGKPLSFLDHHLKVGNSLVGVTLDRLSEPGLRPKTTRAGATWAPVPPPAPAAAPASPPPASPPGSPSAPAPAPRGRGRRAPESNAQLALPFAIDTSLFSGILASIRGILSRPSDTAKAVKEKSQAYARAVGERLEAHRLLADLWCLQWFLGEPDAASIEAYTSPSGLYEQVKRACGLPRDDQRAAALAAVADHPLVRRLREARARGYGPRPEAFCHWPLEFPEVAFDEQGQLRGGFGFDAVIGNPPWDRIRPERRHFYGPYGRPDQGPSWDVANTQAATLEALIGRLHSEHPGLAEGWLAYEAGISALTGFLRDAAVYRHQVVELDGKKTGGDPDTFRYFVERSFQAVRPGGRVGLVVPSTLWQAEGCTGLRRLLLQELTTEELYVYENYRKWAFEIHSSFKFTAFVAAAAPRPPAHEVIAGFMLRDLRAAHGRLPERLVRLTLPLVEALSPGTLALLDLPSDGDAQLVGRLHRALPALAADASGWGARYRCELHMTSDAWRFKSGAWMAERGFLRVRPVRGPDGAWRQERSHGSVTARYPEPLPPGGEYWVAADEAWYRARGYIELPGDAAPRAFVSPQDAAEKPVRGVAATVRHRIVPGAIYTALYEGRMVHNLDHAQKGYVGGEGRQAKWDDLPVAGKVLRSRVYVAADEVPAAPCRVIFCDVTGATNERTALAALLGPASRAGNSTPTLALSDWRSAGLLAGVLSSFVADALLRLRVHNHLNWTYLSQLALPARARVEVDEAAVLMRVLRLSCTTPELAAAWDAVYPEEPWTYERAERDPWTRGQLRAELDALVADAYGLSVPEYARIVTSFPILDRNEPVLPGDAFVTEADGPPRGEQGVAWEETPFGVYERKPRSFITRDLALLTYMRHKSYPPPQRLDLFFRDAVGIDPEGPLSRFRIGDDKDLIDRVERARALGAVPYVPSARGGGGEDAEDDAP